MFNNVRCQPASPAAALVTKVTRQRAPQLAFITVKHCAHASRSVDAQHDATESNLLARNSRVSAARTEHRRRVHSGTLARTRPSWRQLVERRQQLDDASSSSRTSTRERLGRPGARTTRFEAFGGEVILPQRSKAAAATTTRQRRSGRRREARRHVAAKTHHAQVRSSFEQQRASPRRTVATVAPVPVRE